MNSWKSPAGGVKALSILVKADKSYPLHFGYWGDDLDLELSISQKRGLTKLSAMTNDVYLFSAEGEILHFTFSKRGDTSFKAIAPILIEKLNKALTENSSAIAQIKTARNQKNCGKSSKG